MDDLKACPHCGSYPSFSDMEDVDDRRYLEMSIECCAKMTTSFPWGTYRKNTLEENERELKANLTQAWNQRAKVE